jgi:hypothetical protein
MDGIKPIIDSELAESIRGRVTETLHLGPVYEHSLVERGPKHPHRDNEETKQIKRLVYHYSQKLICIQ